MPRSITALICAALLAAVAGCGQTDQEKAREVVQDYVDARGDRNFDAVCDLFSEDFKRQLVAGDNCPAFVAEQTSGSDAEEHLRVVSIRVNGDRAIADLDVGAGSEGPSRIGLVLEKEDGSWRITGLQ